MTDQRIEAAAQALEGRLRMYLAGKQGGAVGWGASVREITETVLAAADAVDPLRAPGAADPDVLGQIIRRVDGAHSLGAGALAEALVAAGVRVGEVASGD